MHKHEALIKDSRRPLPSPSGMQILDACLPSQYFLMDHCAGCGQYVRLATPWEHLQSISRKADEGGRHANYGPCASASLELTDRTVRSSDISHRANEIFSNNSDVFKSPSLSFRLP